MTAMHAVLVVLICNTALLGLIYFRFGKKLERASELLMVTKGTQELAASQVRQTASAVSRVPEVAREAVKEAIAEASNGGEGSVRRSGEMPVVQQSQIQPVPYPNLPR
jgi:hypothetical protein